mgnify:CR=1 FL=1
MINKFDKQNLQQLRQEINAAIKTIVDKHGLGKGSIGNIKFSGDEFRCKLTVNTKSNTSQPLRVSVNLGEVKIGDRFQEKRTVYTITSIDNPGLFKFSVVTHTGKRYKIKPDHIAQMTKI